MSKFNLFVTFDAPFDKGIQDEEPNIAGEDLARYLADELTSQGFEIKSVENVEFAFEIICLSGTIEYEVMVGLDVIHNKWWEVAVKQKYGFFAKLFGKNEDEELGNLLKSLDKILKSNTSVKDIKWYRSYSDVDSLKNKKHFNSPVE